MPFTCTALGPPPIDASDPSWTWRYMLSATASHLDLLEAESIHMLREVVAESGRSAMLYSIGKDSSVIIEGDVIRNHLCKDLGYSKRDRNENIRRIAFIAHLLTRNGIVVLVSAFSPYREARDEARRTIGDFIEVHVDTQLAVCELRDPKELYRKARSGEIHGFTGIDDPYEPPLSPEVVCNTEHESTRQSSCKVVEAALAYLSSGGSRQSAAAKSGDLVTHLAR